MPKAKTRKAAAKRFKITGSGKVMRRGAGLRHILVGKSPKKRKHMSKDRVLSKSDERRIKVMLPYG
ncbi:MAG: 50S ribosomal protein L35 [Candidatus Margulisiibacteriota bacterium]|nr:50S ribosomal protein L35 [Candidatus Margulisiibacteriota bacterium]